MSTQPPAGRTTTPEPHEGIDPYDNAESADRDAHESQPVSRASASGPVTVGSEPGPEQVGSPLHGGTSDGSVLAGVTISEADAAEAVPGDTGPESPGERR